MRLRAFQNIFAGNLLDRANDWRPDEAWLADHLASPGSPDLAIWNGRPLVDKAGEGL